MVVAVQYTGWPEGCQFDSQVAFPGNQKLAQSTTIVFQEVSWSAQLIPSCMGNEIEQKWGEKCCMYAVLDALNRNTSQVIYTHMYHMLHLIWKFHESSVHLVTKFSFYLHSQK